MIVTTIEKLDPNVIPARVQIAVVDRWGKMLNAFGSSDGHDVLLTLPSACNEEIACMAQQMAAQYMQLVEAGLRNGKCGLKNDQVTAIAHQCAVAFERNLTSATVTQMEQIFAAGLSAPALAACYAGIVGGLLIAGDRVQINLVTAGTDGAKTARTIESKKVMMQ